MAVVFKINLFVLILAPLLLISGCSKNEYIEINYVPSRMQLYAPLSTKDIQERSLYNFKVPKESKLGNRLIDLLGSEKKGKFNEKDVLIAVKVDHKNYFIDRNGSIMLGKKITKGDLKEIEKIIEQMIVKYKIKSKLDVEL